MSKARYKKDYISYATLMSAKQGNTLAIMSIVNNFEGYIINRSLRTGRRPDGSEYKYVDTDVRHHMETKLIEAIFKFEIR